MRRAVRADQARAIQAEHHVQMLQRHVVHHLVDGTLHKGRIDVAEGQHAFLGQSAAEGHRMLLGNTHVEGTVGETLHQIGHRAARRHGGGYTHDALVLLGQLDQCLAEDVLELGRLSLCLFLDALAGHRVELAGCVPDGGLFLGLLEALALDGADVQHLRPTEVLDLAQGLHERHHVVPVHGPEVADVEALEDVLSAREERLHAVGEAYQRTAQPVADQSMTLQRIVGLVAQQVVALAGGDARQVMVEGTHVLVDGHLVVVEQDEQIVGVRRSIVQAFEGHASADRCITDDGHHLSLVTFQIVCHGHTQGSRNAVRGMTRRERIVLALLRCGESAQATQLAQGCERVASACQYLMGIGLMTHIPHQPVLGRVVHIVQGHDDLDGSQARSKVSGVDAHLFDDELSKRLADIRQLLDGQFPEISRTIDSVQYVLIFLFQSYILFKHSNTNIASGPILNSRSRMLTSAMKG